MMDPNTQLIKSLSSMLSALQTDIDQKRVSDQELLKVMVTT